MFKLIRNPFTVRNIDWPSPHYPDGTLMLKDLPEFVDRIEWLYDNDAELFTLICLRQHYPESCVDLALPYVPHARMDRVKSESEMFTLKAFCDTINAMKFRHVEVFDPHSNVTPALLNNVKVHWPTANIHDVHMNLPAGFDTTLFFPDEGAMKRYSALFPGKPYIFGMKDRDWATGKIRKLIVNGDESLIKGKDILIVDDICSKGGTFFHSAKALKEKGAADIYLYVSHCENSVYEGDMIKSGLIKKIFTTNTILRPIPQEESAPTYITALNWDIF